MPRKPNYNRDDLIDRARNLFWQRGWAGTSLKDLEAELQMKPGSFYAAFGSKDALFELAIEKYAADGVERLNNLARDNGPIEALKRFPNLVITKDDAPAKACMLSKTLLELQPRGHPLAEKANRHLLRMEGQFCELFEQAQMDGAIDSKYDPRMLAQKYQSDLMGVRVMAERDSVDAQVIAAEIANGLDRLK
ncbi:MAG: helix-turn-helix domain-containing protein [Pseudomonadota bacterium]